MILGMGVHLRSICSNVVWLGLASSPYLIFPAESYVKASIRNVEAWLADKGERLKTKVSCVFLSGWKPELDVTPLLSDEDACYYQQQIGVMRWMVDLGRIDICTECSKLAAFSAAPRHGHLAVIFHVFAHLKAHQRSKLVLDPRYVEHAPHAKVELFKGWEARLVVCTRPRWVYIRILGSGFVWKCD